MQLSSGGSQTSKKKKPSYPTPKKGIVGVTTKKTPIKSSHKKSSSKHKSTSYSGGGNSGLMDRFFNAIKHDAKKVATWAKKPGHLVPTKIYHVSNTPTKKPVAKKPAPKKKVVHKPVAKPTIIRKAPVLPKSHAPSKASAYDKFKAIQKTAAHTVQKPTSIVKKGTTVQKPSNALGQAGLDPKKYYAATTTKKPTISKPTTTKSPVVAKPKTGTYTPPRPSSVTPTKAPVTPSKPVTPGSSVPSTPTTSVPTGTTSNPTTSTPTSTPNTPVTSVSNPYTDQQSQLAKDRQAALNAQDVALNQGLTVQDANNFQQQQSIQQQMTQRGMGDSGIAADAYMRATMGANQNYQQAYTDTANKKAEIQSNFDSQISNSKIAQQNYNDAQAATRAKAANDEATAQTEQDKYLTSATGTVFLGGKQLVINGKPVQSMDWNKLNETQRHNLATEANTATANANTAINNANNYTLGQDKNAIARETAANNLTIAIKRNELDFAKLDYNYTKLESDNADQQSKLQIAIANAQTSKDKTQLTALGKQADGYAKQIAAYQKVGKKPPKSLVDNYNKTNNAISSIVGGSSFKSSGGGGDYSNAPSGSPAAFGGFRRVNQAPASFNNHMSQAIAKGVPFAQAKLLTELIGRESSFQPSIKNPTSSAYGYGQFLTSTRNAYAKKYPEYNYSNPVDQIVLTYKYIQERYGTVQHALEMWEKRSPHWY